MELWGWSMQVLLRFALLHSELLSLLEVSNANHTAKQQGRKALNRELLLMNVQGNYINLPDWLLQICHLSLNISNIWKFLNHSICNKTTHILKIEFSCSVVQLFHNFFTYLWLNKLCYKCPQFDVQREIEKSRDILVPKTKIYLFTYFCTQHNANWENKLAQNFIFSVMWNCKTTRLSQGTCDQIFPPWQRYHLSMFTTFKSFQATFFFK